LCLRWIDSVGGSGKERSWYRGEKWRENKSTASGGEIPEIAVVADATMRARSSNFVAGGARDMVWSSVVLEGIV
jgi:hypothetical protein